MNTHIVIMAGGIGSRFWPMSTPEYPKQFIDVMGCGKSLIQLTVERFAPLCPMENFWVVTSEKYTDIVKEQLPDLPECNILAEPTARNTAPCIAYACWKIKKQHPQANIVVTPSDALVINTGEFQRVMRCALDFTATNSSIVTIGIKPSRPETGYGYIQIAEPAGDNFYKVKTFTEKPELELAKVFVESGEFYWNSGLQRKAGCRNSQRIRCPRQLLLECRHFCVERGYHNRCHTQVYSGPGCYYGRNEPGFLHSTRGRHCRKTLPHL